jgi:DNA-binding NarL/FixJ family response regulator
MQMRPRIVAADDNPHFLGELCVLLEDDFDVVETATNGTAALESIFRCQPDVAILDLTMPGLNGIEVTRRLRTNGVRPAVLICSVENDPEILDAASEAGANGYVFKDRVAQDLIDAVKTVAQGRSFRSNSSHG